MRFLKLNQYESRQIAIAISDGKFQKWMGRYINSKDFYKIKGLLVKENLSIKDLHRKFEILIKQDLNICIAYKQYKNLTKLSYTLFLFNLLKKNKNHETLKKLINCSNYDFLKSSFNEKNISIINKDIFEKFLVNFKEINPKMKTIELFAPICPDYQTAIDDYGNERYTFDGLGGGIGLVGRKFLENLPSLIEIFKLIDIDLKPIILLGDFENNHNNLNRLKISPETFISLLKSSKEKFEKEYNLKAELFAEFFGGINSWQSRIQNLKNDYCFKNLKSLEDKFPNIDHQHIFAARIPLYKRWYGETNLMTNSFINQIYEYILMGNIISGYHKPCILLSSDHKAMAPYYATSFNSAPVISLNNIY